MSGRGAVLVNVGALLAALAVGLGAFGAHVLKNRLGPEALEWWTTAVTYLLPHAIAVVAIGSTGRTALFLPARLLAIGSALFAATLFAMALGAPRWLGAVTPLGGISMIVGWLWLGQRVLRER